MELSSAAQELQVTQPDAVTEGDTSPATPRCHCHCPKGRGDGGGSAGTRRGCRGAAPPFRNCGVFAALPLCHGNAAWRAGSIAAQIVPKGQRRGAGGSHRSGFANREREGKRSPCSGINATRGWSGAGDERSGVAELMQRNWELGMAVGTRLCGAACGTVGYHGQQQLLPHLRVCWELKVTRSSAVRTGGSATGAHFPRERGVPPVLGDSRHSQGWSSPKVRGSASLRVLNRERGRGAQECSCARELMSPGDGAGPGMSALEWLS